MDKTKIEFLIKNGFTIDEIMKMEPEQKEQKPEDPVETKTEEPNKFDKMLADFKKELSDMREEMHKQNRARNVIEETPKQTTFEEDIEKMIEEVTK